MGMWHDQSRTKDYFQILMMHLLNHFAVYTLPVVILYLRDDFTELNYTGTGILWTSLVVTNTILSIFTGFYADSHRDKRYPMIYGSFVIMILGWFLIPIANTYTQLIAVFIFIGIGASGFHPTAFTLITEMFKEDKGKALSYNMAIGLAGNSVAPLIFAGLVFGFSTYYIAIIISAIIFGAIALGLYLFARRANTFERIDWRPEEEQHIQSSNVDIMFLLSPLIIVPLLYSSIRNSFFKTSSLFTSLLYEDYLSLSKEQAAIATAILLGFASIFIIVGGYITDNTKPRIAILISSIGTLIAAWALVYLNNFTNIMIFSSFFFSLNAFYYIGSPATSALLANRVRPEQRGKLYGALFSFGQILSLGTPIAFGFINDTYGIRSAFQFILVLAAIAFILGIFIYFEEKSRLSNQNGEEQEEVYPEMTQEISD